MAILMKGNLCETHQRHISSLPTKTKIESEVRLKTEMEANLAVTAANRLNGVSLLTESNAN